MKRGEGTYRLLQQRLLVNVESRELDVLLRALHVPIVAREHLGRRRRRAPRVVHTEDVRRRYGRRLDIVEFAAVAAVQRRVVLQIAL